MRITELLDLLLRWFHVIAGIMWIGNSVLYNWLDRNLVKDPNGGRLSQGKIWLLHSGAFYEVEKKLLEPGEMPKSKLHWFMWQNFSTWASGILLLIVVYYLGEGAWLVNPGAGHVSYSTAVAIAVATLVGGWVLYDLLWRSPLKKRPLVAGAICLSALVAIAWYLPQVMTPRAAYIHVGVLLGTLMTGNVWGVIIPSQVELTTATREGREQDPTYSIRAKQRSVHNNYMTFPLIFIMVSNHFPAFYSHRLNWAILLVLMLGGALVRHFMNIRWSFGWWRPALAASAVGSIAAACILLSQPAATAYDEAALAAEPPIAFEEVHAVIAERCVACHSKTPSDSLFKAAPNGITFDQPAEIRAEAERIKVRVGGHTMPFANRTNMTEDERRRVVKWVVQGAKIQ